MAYIFLFVLNPVLLIVCCSVCLMFLFSLQKIVFQWINVLTKEYID